jgi:mannosyltransferase
MSDFNKLKQVEIEDKDRGPRYLIWLLFLVVIAFVLRIYNLTVTGFWMDEIHSAFGVDPRKSIPQLIEYCKQDQPPFFFLTLHAWFKVFPFTDFYGRLFVVITGCLGVVAMFFLGKELRSGSVGLACAFITTINYFLIDLSRQMRFYPLVFLLTTLSFLFFYRVIKRQAIGDFVGYMTFTALLLNTHYFGIVVFVTQFLLLIIACISQKITDWKFITKAIVAGIFTALSFAHWLPVVLSDLGINHFHIAPIKWWFPIQYWWVYFQDPIACIAFVGLIIMASKIYYVEYKRSGHVGLTPIMLIGWILFSFLIPITYSLIRIPMLEYKYTVIALPAIFVLIAVGIEACKTKLIVTGAVVLTISYLAISFYFRPLYYRKPFEEWREITAYIKKTDGGDQFVFSNYAWYFRYYFNQYDIQHQPFEPQYADFASLADQANRIYVITNTRYVDSGLLPDQSAYLQEHFQKKSETKFADAVATLYTRRIIE